MNSTPTTVCQAFRARYAQEVLPAAYSGRGHLASVVLAAGTGIAVALWLASTSWRLADAWIVPFTVLFANTVEYWAHRGPMHHRMRGLRALHLRHATRHHRYFTDDAMHFESTRDFHAVLFPPVLLLFFGGIAAAIGGLSALVLPRAAAALFVATALGYYLIYETLHFLYHVPPEWPAGKLPGVRWLAQLHRTHHNARCMQNSNFNLVFPLWDWVAGTLDAHSAPQSPAEQPVHNKERPT